MLLERVFLRVGSADSEEQLANCISKFLAPVLLKLSTSHDTVRNKVVELLTHLNKRLKTYKTMQLPLLELLDTYRNTTSSFVQNFTIIYIKVGFPRMSVEEQLDLLPALFSAVEGKPQNNMESIIMLFLESLVNIKVSVFMKRRNDIFDGKPKLTKVLLDYTLDILLLPIVKYDSIPPGMSEYSHNRVISELSDPSYRTDKTDLEKLKITIIELLSSQIFEYEKLLTHAVIASKDPRTSVCQKGENLLAVLLKSIKKFGQETTLPLYALFTGSDNSVQIEKSKQKNSLSPAVKVKILEILIKIRQGAIIWPACIQIAFLALQLGTTENKDMKLMSLGFQFTHLMISEVRTEELEKVAIVLLNSAFLKILDPKSDYSDTLRQQAYTSAGLLVKKVPFLVRDNIKIVFNFFNALSEVENHDTKVAIKEALISMSSAFRDNKINEAMLDELLTFLATQCDASVLSGFAVIHYLVNVFPTSNASARFILLLIAGKSHPDLSEEAKKHLYGYDHNIESEMKLEDLPSFCNMTETVLRELESRSPIDFNKPGTRLPMPVSNLSLIFSDLSLCLKHSAGIKSISCHMRHPSNETPKVAHYLKHLHTSQPKILSDYVQLLQRALETEVNFAPLFCLVECVGTIPEIIVPQLTIKLDLLETLFGHSREDIRENIALLYGPFTSYSLTDTEFDDRIFKICESSLDPASKALEMQHGTMLAIATAIEWRILKQVGCSQDWVVLKKIILTAFQFLNQSNPILLSAACNTFGQLGRITPLPLLEGKTRLSENPGKLDVFEKLMEFTNNEKLVSKVRLLACKAIGMLCIGDAQSRAHVKLIFDTFLSKAKDHKNIDIHLAVGETLVCCILGSSHKLARNMWVMSESEFSHSSEDFYPILDEILSKLLEKVSYLHPNSRQATCIWLYTITKECARAKPVLERLKEIQSSFVEFLSENNEMVQTLGSKGLALVYDNGDAAVRAELVDLLVRQLSEGKRSVIQVTSDTKLFEDDALGKAPTGANLTTYKDICSFASDMNQPDLIYTFLNMANHNALWNSKKGAAFGFSSIAENAREQLAPHLSKIIPRLYRYQFDPTPRTQASMSAIWQSLVPEPSKTIELYHKEIFVDLIKNLTSNHYRVRQSCCSALTDFLRGPGSSALESCVDSIPELWSSLFRVMDDVHDSTRKSAQKSATIISQICVRRCDSKYGKSGEAMIKALLTPILDKGISNQVSEVRTISLLTVSELVKSSGNFLREHLVTLIPALLEATEDLELAGAYASTRLSSDASSQEKFDDFRASLVKSHYTTQTVSKCVQYLTNDVLKELAPRIIELLRVSVSLSTRIAASHFIVLVVLEATTSHIDLQPYSGKILSALLNGLTDRNSSIRNTYAAAVGHVVRISKDSSVDKLIKKLNTIFVVKEDTKIRSALGSALAIMMKHSPDKLKSQSDALIPLTFYAMQAEDKDLKKVWEDLWHDIAPSSESAILRNIDSVCNFLKTMLDSPSWNEKAQAATGMKVLASKLGEQLSLDHRKRLIEYLLEGLAGRTWTGKENLLAALTALCYSYPKVHPVNDNLPNLIADLVLKECRKENLKYRTKALSAVGVILRSLEVDRFSAVYDIVQEVNAKRGESLVDESDNLKEKTEKQNSLTALKEAAFITLGEAWPKNSATQTIYQEKIITQCVSCLNTSERSVQVAVMSALHRYIDGCAILEDKVEDPSPFKNMLPQILEALSCALAIKKHSKLRIESLTIILLLAKKLKDVARMEELEELKQLFNSHLESLSTDSSPEIKCRVADIKTYFELST
ncbi:proteasome adapter and scaffold protein ECM29 isoform X3 [Bemisia tabaci]